MNRPVHFSPVPARRIAGIAAVFLLLLGASAWYFLYFIQTPQYALRALENAFSEHDLDQFDKRVDLDALLDRAYDDLASGVSASDQGSLPEVQAVVDGFAKLFKQPLVDHFKGVVRHYVATGQWTESAVPAAEQPIDVSRTSAEIAAKSGLLRSVYRGVSDLEANGDEAIARLKVFEPDTAQEFELQLLLRRREDTGWQVVQISNLRDYARQVRQTKTIQLKKYFEETQPIIDKCSDTVTIAEEKLEAIASAANLAQPLQREKVKAILQDDIIPAWQARADALDRIQPPPTVRALHELQQRLCALQIQCAQKDAAWTDDYNPATRKEANDLRQQAAIVSSQTRALLFELRADLD